MPGHSPAALTVLVVDDEPPALAEMAFLLRQDDRVADVVPAPSGTHALQALEERDVDAVFLDIAMPGLTGLDLAKVLSHFAAPPPVVFVTAHEDHAVDAFELDAVDYLLKPVRPERLREALRRVVEHRQDGQGAQPPDDDETIPVELAGVTRFVQRSQVRYVEAHGDYARLHTDKQTHLVRIPLATLEERWREAGFVRIHRSLLVSLAHIRELRLDGGRCTVLVGDDELQVSRRHTRELRELIVRRSPLGAGT